ncbi:hypothetical protein N2603_38850 [Bradyrhizobium huanghuaihaiense]|uniref:hypothetical protein n=1 Tax=Bradyrhizobium huanghuaihaiense TaxID=990078 RepID=UPI0021A9B4AB|nr:hypothetical protein [Bradyrhizobium sp. CB3035]UWU81607.1 hypothetical protein N2603_38850 [Bradyrhizobium sp. CB3035]
MKEAVGKWTDVLSIKGLACGEIVGVEVGDRQITIGSVRRRTRCLYACVFDLN